MATLSYALLTAVKRYPHYLNACQINFHEAEHMCAQYYANPINGLSTAKVTNVSVLFWTTL